MIIGEFCDVFPPELDGVGTVVSNYVKQLNNDGNKCYYVAPKPNKDMVIGISSMNYTSIPIPKEAYRLGLPFIDISYNSLVSKTRFDIVHAHSPFTAGHEAKRVAKQKGIPIVASFHSKYYDDFYSKTHSDILAKAVISYIVRFYYSCDEVWTVNPSSAEVLESYGYKRDIFIMPNGTDLWYPTEQDCKTAQEKFNLGDGKVFLFVGQQNFKKNIRHIIEALALYAKKYDDFKMVFVGQGPDSEKIKQLVSDLGLSNRTVFTGQIVDRDIMKSIYGRADLLIFPSLYDTCGLVVREAAAALTPSLVIRNSCASEGMIHNENGFLCEDTPESICSCIIDALPLCNQVGIEAQKVFPLPWSTVAQQVLTRYQTIIWRGK
ncbi:MAG: glycosyltransferase [Eubacteriales bacterium]|nr:glycosyltransferase [Eubacteriales bacterium]